MHIFHEYSSNIARMLAESLENGNVICFPTETVFGLMCDARNKDAIKKIFQIKRRPEEKVLSICVPEKYIDPAYFDLTEAQQKKFVECAKNPPVTMVVPPKNLPWNISHLLSEGGEIGIRVTHFPELLYLLEEFDSPIAQTSMNISGMPTAKTPTEFLSQVKNFEKKSGALKGKPKKSSNLLLPESALEIKISDSPPSRVVRILENGELEYIR